ncbi:MAG: hypothetical protein ABI036_13660 [Fibrobacteria bacterium]
MDTANVNAHTAFLPSWLGLVAKKATEELRLRYGKLYGFEYATPSNAEMVAGYMTNYKWRRASQLGRSYRCNTRCVSA